MRYPTVFQPCRIGSLSLKNRLAMSQMTMNYATEEGDVTDKLIAYYRDKQLLQSVEASGTVEAIAERITTLLG